MLSFTGEVRDPLTGRKGLGEVVEAHGSRVWAGGQPQAPQHSLLPLLGSWCVVGLYPLTWAAPWPFGQQARASWLERPQVSEPNLCGPQGPERHPPQHTAPVPYPSWLKQLAQEWTSQAAP